ncbi:carbohydrate sulfotransferase 14-like [Ptychodera flava]|uniref:carbohydrate sulfotransferase 14-like n=1 Tax=Ptychodera flava TaxID=63121 RepID=UPI00396A5A04
MVARKWGLTHRKAVAIMCCCSLTALLLVFLQLPSDSYRLRTAVSLTRERLDGTVHTRTPANTGPKIPPPRTFQNFSRENVCRNGTKGSISELSAEQKRMLYQQTIVNDEYGFLYCVVPKVACSNWKRVVRVLNGQWEKPHPARKIEHRVGFKFLSDYTEEEQEHKIKHYYKFMFVRHPFARLLSAYRDKFGRPETVFVERYGTYMLQQYRKVATVPINASEFRITLGEFVKFVIEQPIRQMDQHWRPMHEICQPCAVNYSYIGKLENLRGDADQVFKELYVQDLVEFPHRQLYYNETRYPKPEDEIAKLPKEDILRYVTKFSLDFSIFSYSYDDVL